MSSASHSVLVPLGAAIFPGATRAGPGQAASYEAVFKLLALNLCVRVNLNRLDRYQGLFHGSAVRRR